MSHPQRIAGLRDYLAARATSDFAIGTVTKNAVDAAIEVAYRRGRPLMLIASRRQIDCEEFAGGYVGNWTTESFARYVRDRDPKRLIFLCRDHGGPWQHPNEWTQSEREAMASAQRSFEADIDAGFDILHIDTGISPKEEPPQAIATERLVTLYQGCFDYSQRKNKALGFEIGTEDQSEEAAKPRAFRRMWLDITSRLKAQGLPQPVFVVAQTGTKVVETRNIGAFAFSKNRRAVSRDVRSFVECINQRGALIKAHNCDYLDPKTLALFAHLGVGAINVAPEIGVQETTYLLELLQTFRCEKLRDRFIDLSVGAGKWKKWLHTTQHPTPMHCCLLGGHYVFSAPEFNEIKSELAAIMGLTLEALDAQIRNRLVSCIERYWLCTEYPHQSKAA